MSATLQQMPRLKTLTIPFTYQLNSLNISRLSLFLFPCIAKYFFNRFRLKVKRVKYCVKTTERSRACGHHDVPAPQLTCATNNHCNDVLYNNYYSHNFYEYFIKCVCLRKSLKESILPFKHIYKWINS